MVRPVRAIVIAVLVLLVAFASAWSSLALWYRFPLPEVGRHASAILFGLFGASVVVALFGRRRSRAVLAFAAAFVLVLVWWSTIEPQANGAWAPDVDRQVTGEFDGDLLTLTNVRDFEWRSSTDFTERWTTRSYDLNKLKSVDMFMSYWSGPTIAHVIMSFGFDDGRYLAWSIEVRRLSGGSFSPLADLFKNSPLIILAADERDVIGLRSNFRGEDVQIYRLRASPAAARLLLREYVSDANALAATPAFYNSLTANCTTTIIKMMHVAGDAVPTDWRLVVNGYLPEYAYDRGALDISVPLSQLRSAAHIAARAHDDGVSPNFSQAIRVAVPSPQDAL
ncbi:DUF4105 domain-containing protein [Rhizobium leguminosarum]|uniref:Lnb N-terminal periplasmic domain-containing protein n=1 Tax=Rhizobium leguminosarum TaxID=384 RepID=UPI0003700267|nr:DUF4105 domain-containing protein [Rhizobium leguminosarum]MBY2963787.1 DUF4105 domain-containing protein [Rhizobium leguminosarum]